MEKSQSSCDTRKRSVVVDVDNTKDRISDLPNRILGKIIVKLPLDEAVRIMALSKRWKSIWDDN
ncbi:T2E6.24 [Arabidopsis thaliana]|uniref:Putative F-box protein At1g47702 n=1 Tax=Arabidopsis thaliana TaxID=3702 RepID=FB41_ARATH|nr:RecName: Full=Putative F-box protein At1g47702 [Arabidopsis thaliana]AAF99795.1 T2E6.24 [Arabidopsis thaliana]